jgi:O-antigen/teichoic acid export membrane protein
MSQIISIKKNIVYSSILTVSNFVFPLVTFPYVTRVLGVANIGIYNFVDNVINYFILFSMLGISVLGIREIAKTKNNLQELQKTFSGLFYLNAIGTSIMLLILFCTIILVPKFHEHDNMMWLGVIKLLFNLFLIEWYYKGMEDFSYITYRTIFVRIVYVITVFIFVTEQNDYQIYYALSVGTLAVNAIINWRYARKTIRLIMYNHSWVQYIRPYFIVGCYLILTSMYTSFNVVYLGFVSGETEVGYYTTATKLYAILLALYSAYTGVMMPRISALSAEGNIVDIKRLIDKSYNILFTFTLPIIVIVLFFTPQIIFIIAGHGFNDSIIPMRIIVPLLLIIGIEQILVNQLLMPLNHDKSIFINSLAGSFVGIVLNILLVPILKSIGSSVVWVCAELVVLFFAYHYVVKNIHIHFPWEIFIKHLIVGLPMILFCYAIINGISNEMLQFLAAIVLCSIYFLVAQLLILKNEIFVNILKCKS